MRHSMMVDISAVGLVGSSEPGSGPGQNTSDFPTSTTANTSTTMTTITTGPTTSTEDDSFQVLVVYETAGLRPDTIPTGITAITQLAP